MSGKSRRRAPGWRVALGIAGAAFASAACVQFTDTIAFENRTESPLMLHLVVEGAFVAFDCNGDGADRAQIQGEADAEIAAGGRVCLEGPATNADSPYDARDRIDLVEVRRDSSVCMALEGEALYAAFGEDQFQKVLPIDDQRCPAPTSSSSY